MGCAHGTMNLVLYPLCILIKKAFAISEVGAKRCRCISSDVPCEENPVCYLKQKLVNYAYLVLTYSDCLCVKQILENKSQALLD